MAWYHISNPELVASPALLVYPDRIEGNIEEMLRVAGTPNRLRPHVKTHKCREIVALQQKAGIEKFKCATIAEAEMLAICKVKDVLLAYQPTGPNVKRLIELVKEFPNTVFGTLVDNPESARLINMCSSESGISMGLFIDLDVGMHRTGISPGPEAQALKTYIAGAGNLIFRGWHVYDGHIRNAKFQDRQNTVSKAFTSTGSLMEDESDVEMVFGGSPTFPVHAMNPKVSLSPGTCLLWDQGYSRGFQDQKFQHAAVLLTRVISKPDEQLLCLDLGHKAVASEMPHPRVYFPELKQVEFVGHSEEHLVIKTGQASNFRVGDLLYGIPAHICPTTALHQELVVIENGKAVDRWEVFARDRRITI